MKGAIIPLKCKNCVCKFVPHNPNSQTSCPIGQVSGIGYVCANQRTCQRFYNYNLAYSMVFNAVFNSTLVISASAPIQFPGVLLTTTPYNILSKPLAAFPHNQCRNNGQPWEWNESCRNDYHQSLERIPSTGRSGDQTSDLLFSSLQCYQLSYGALQISI